MRGSKIVPREPDQAMMDAGRKAFGSFYATMTDLWHAMYEAAPSAAPAPTTREAVEGAIDAAKDRSKTWLMAATPAHLTSRPSQEGGAGTAAAPAASAAPDVADALCAQLRETVRAHTPGQCKMFSIGDLCTCDLCAVDKLRAMLRSRASAGEDAVKDYDAILREYWTALRAAERTAAERGERAAEYERLSGDYYTLYRKALDRAGTLSEERDALAAAMPSEGADAALAYAAEHTLAQQLGERLRDMLNLYDGRVYGEIDRPDVVARCRAALAPAAQDKDANG